jgi:hypothetical protein
MAQYAGRTGVAYVASSADGAATAVVKLNQWTLNMTADRIDTTGFGDSNKTYVKGFRDARGTLSGFWDDTNDVLYDASQAEGAVKMYLYPSSLVSSKYFYGTAEIDFSLDVTATDAVKVSGEWTAAAGTAWTFNKGA